MTLQEFIDKYNVDAIKKEERSWGSYEVVLKFNDRLLPTDAVCGKGIHILDAMRDTLILVWNTTPNNTLKTIIGELCYLDFLTVKIEDSDRLWRYTTFKDQPEPQEAVPDEVPDVLPPTSELGEMLL